ncbi:DUF2842 domain-containing protein [Blastochloris viridis]|uniref:DUF2842 domain-containing protein n=1 Tax=Blastochloris viridis TaxID=1079 RepID=A0A0H5BPZ3_BLAVI|nr:DUF2842 domain-containing protein [Blastochloris viridis]ALK09980.1 hypothetical protein BVIR_2212 [Blastochloris viridis]BAS00104.1 hypothetical protein BV133_2510 [Blastochloris viridis]CUU42643.1 hypothetical protein BVIRIDIS_16570 [Blastochloris viridis]
MRQRVRKAVGAVLLLLLAVVWSLGAMVVAHAGIGLGHWATELAYYIVAGLGWTIPAGALIWWMVRPDRAA